MSKIILGYYRKSIIDGPTASPDRQRHAIETWAARNGFSPDQIEWFGDLDLSGRDESNRPEWQKLLQRLDDPRVAAVAVESYDRSHRNVRQFLAFYDDQLKPRGIRLVSATQSMDLSTTDGRTMAIVAMAFAEAESRKASDRMTAQIHYLKTVKAAHWGRIPFGCDVGPDRRLIPSTRFYHYNPTTGEALAATGEPPPGFEIRYFFDGLAAMYHLYATGQYSYYDVAQMLNHQGWRNWEYDRATPKPFVLGKVRSAVEQSNIYAGQSLNSEPHEPILPVELCAAVAAAHRKRSNLRDPGNRNHKTYTWLLSGVLRCAACGSRMTGQKGSGGNYYYKHLYYHGDCPERLIRADDLEARIIGLMIPIIEADLDGIIGEIKSIFEEAASADDADLGKLRAKESELERLIDLHVSGLINREQFERRQIAIQMEIDDLKNKIPAQSSDLAGIDSLVEELISGIDQLPHVERPLQKTIIHSITETIHVAGGQVTRIVPTLSAKPLFELMSFAGEHAHLR